MRREKSMERSQKEYEFFTDNFLIYPCFGICLGCPDYIFQVEWFEGGFLPA